MARVELIDATTAPDTVAEHFAGDDPGPVVAALANVPELVGPTLAFVRAALGPGAAGARCKAFAILRTSALHGCRHGVLSSSADALDVGLSVDEVRALRGEASLEGVLGEERERAMVRWIDAVGGATGPVPADVWNEVRRHWPETVLVELSVTIGATMFLNRFATGLELPASAETLARLQRVGLP